MSADDAWPVSERGKDAMGEQPALLLLALRSDVVAQGQYHAALAVTERQRDAAERARDIAKLGDGVLRPRRRVVEPVEIVGASEDFGTVGLVEGEEFRLASQRDIAPAAAEAGNADPLRHVLAIVPFVEIAAPLRRDVVPDRHHPLTRETHV